MLKRTEWLGTLSFSCKDEHQAGGCCTLGALGGLWSASSSLALAQPVELQWKLWRRALAGRALTLEQGVTLQCCKPSGL